MLRKLPVRLLDLHSVGKNTLQGFIFLASSLFFACLANGTTIARVAIEKLVNDSELIFEGEVIDVRSSMDQRGYIYTYVDFKVTDVIVGSNAGSDNLTLRFTGGSVGEVRLDVGSIIPVLGEKGIYFVEQITPGLVNPLLGWTQGHFTIAEDGSVIAGNAQKVQAIQKDVVGPQEISQGVAKGVITDSGAIKARTQRSASEANAQPMSVEAFKQRILEFKI